MEAAEPVLGDVDSPSGVDLRPNGSNLLRLVEELETGEWFVDLAVRKEKPRWGEGDSLRTLEVDDVEVERRPSVGVGGARGFM